MEFPGTKSKTRRNGAENEKHTEGHLTPNPENGFLSTGHTRAQDTHGERTEDAMFNLCCVSQSSLHTHHEYLVLNDTGPSGNNH